MITIVIAVLAAILVVTVFFLIAAIAHILKIQQELEELGKEQHNQNKELIEMMKYRQQSSEMLLQHIEILKYLVEKDPVLTKSKWEA